MHDGYQYIKNHIKIVFSYTSAQYIIKKMKSDVQFKLCISFAIWFKQV